MDHQPAFSFGGRYDTEKPSKTPAPGAYSPEKVNLDHQPAFSFGSRPEEKIKSIVPAPNHYQPEKCNLDHQAAFTFGSRPEQKIRSDSPAPNVYSPEKCKLEHLPAFTFGGRHNTEKPSKTPGKQRDKIRFDTSIFMYPNYIAAPGDYAPEKCNLDHQTAFSFGLRPEAKVRSDTPGKMTIF